MRAKSVLLIGEPAARPHILMERLAGWGVPATFVSSGSEAAELLRSRRFDLVVTRLQLQDTNAFELMPRVDQKATDLFVCLPNGNGFEWLPLMRSGKDCVGSSVLHTTEFLTTVEKLFVTKQHTLSCDEAAG